MKNQPLSADPVLEVAWRKFAQFDLAADARSKAYMRLRKWIALLGVLATLLAIITAIYPEDFSALGKAALKVLLVSSPFAASALAAYASKSYASGDWLITRAGAEEILKEIYQYRTILQNVKTRRDWLESRVQEIQRSVFRGMNGELVINSYDGVVPPAPRFQNPDSDAGFGNLTGGEYFEYRLQDQLIWHEKALKKKDAERSRLQAAILILGVAGALLAAVNIGLWVALAASLTAALLGWQELRNLDLVIRNYSKVRLELSIIADHWETLSPEERTQSEFYHMVRSAEEVMWSRNVEYIKAMQEALKESNLDEQASLINRVIQEQRDSERRLRLSMNDDIVEQANAFMRGAEETLGREFNSALTSLAKEASSELVQAELASMRDAINEKVGDVLESFGLGSAIRAVDEEFSSVDAGRDTPPAILNALMSRYPKNADTKG